MSSEMLKGHLDLLLLAVLEDGPLHGYALIEALTERSGGAIELPEGTIYPALHRLERAGLLGSEWSEATGRRRRTYALTESGRGSLQTRRAEWGVFKGAIERVVGAVQRSGAPGRPAQGHAAQGKGAPWPSQA